MIPAAISAASAIYSTTRARKAPKEQHERQKQLQEHAKEQQLDIWNKTNYPEQRKKIEEAGLNAGLLYGMGGTGGATTGSVGAGNAGQEQVYDMGTQATNAALAKAQIELAKSQAEKNKAEAEKIKGVDTAATEATTKLTNIQAEFKRIETDVAGDSQYYQREIIAATADKLIREASIAANENKISDETVNDRIRQIKEEAIGANLENAIKRSGNEVNEARVKEIAANIMQRWEQLKLQGKNIEATIENMEKLTEAMLWGAGINAAGNLVGDVVKIATKQTKNK